MIHLSVGHEKYSLLLNILVDATTSKALEDPGIRASTTVLCWGMP